MIGNELDGVCRWSLRPLHEELPTDVVTVYGDPEGRFAAFL